MNNTDVLEVFKSIVVDEYQRNELNMEYTARGVILDFCPNSADAALITERYKPLNMRTLFSAAERENSNLISLIRKQVFHYLEVYGLDTPGLFNLEFDDGSVVAMTLIKGITKYDLEGMVTNLIYTNAPVKDAEQIVRIIREFNIAYDINKIVNNELRVLLFDLYNDVFDNGDDAVRWMCYEATGNALLIKSKEVEEAVKQIIFDVEFFENHTKILSQVFNRHKRLIMAAKKFSNKTAINKISRLSKTNHVPIHESVSKRFVSAALSGEIGFDVLNKISVRDHFKFLNLLAYKRQGNTTDAFIIRNGKIHIEEGRKVWDQEQISIVEKNILTSLRGKLSHLYDENILLDPQVDYGLPISNKQTIGHLPFGTRIIGSENDISSGIYWENSWGARDLDLSTIDIDGFRTGWGDISGYDNSNPVTFSGDIVDATDGAMEFMTSSNKSYGLFVNIYSGEVGCGVELVVGTKSSDHWMKDTVIREKTTLDSRGSIVGFVQGKDFIVYKGRMSYNNTSGDRERAIVIRGMSDFWTISKLFNALNINYGLDNKPNKVYNKDLSYKGVTFDKLQSLFTAKEVP